ncbi:cyclin-dependent kinase 4-like [Leptopilina heterotoma]|uniref:cyclin-dependent kinase 4-like n=1 Tax=Leptopilina heterotoma TaxID=63436 RepID=UPI001CA8CB11|nr:cyclin-dependent kinase 4-like [Leptopilina heterotoma]XP_043480794.1 cyclin-dependent kinase 4-like [Leptopilina heterotoma]XP_043480795.1 cyclin-dependent kinase 4-like [Leptopilina heterotoma]XP_043480796.1 cyclin-dependent kinase 4-like [Leptopilina heterotoma]XP_043480797.1 cyclin-dependent kinase 4-like [Leptopilina heterotoma]XP_043480798.1 cyclin-dependent kinase 4-like [Leptopilina heterotoma]
MAGRLRRSSCELNTELSSPTPRKRTRKSDESDNIECGEKSLDVSLETSEKLSPSDESGNSSAEGSFILFHTRKSEQKKENTTLKPSKEGNFYIEEKSIESKKKHVSRNDILCRKTSSLEEGSSREIIESGDSGIGSSSRSNNSEMGRPIGEQEQTSLMGEHAFYQELSLIGNGAYGTVYKAKDLTSGQVVALKKVRVPLTEDGLPTSTLREIATLKQLERFEHPHIVRLLDVCQGNYLQLPLEDNRSERVDRGLTLWLVFEHVERDLASYLSSCATTGINSCTRQRMSKEILQGVDFLHSHRITHRDLKPQNLLVTSEGRIKIADFGLAKTYDFEMRLTSVVVTLWYRAPEVLLGCPYATPVDIWSIGCILAEINRLSPLFPGTSEGDQLDRIFQVIGTPPRHEWPDNVSLSQTAFPERNVKPLDRIIPNINANGLDLIKNMLTFKPQDRITAAQALKHSYFSEEAC